MGSRVERSRVQTRIERSASESRQRASFASLAARLLRAALHLLAVHAWEAVNKQTSSAPGISHRPGGCQAEAELCETAPFSQLSCSARMARMSCESRLKLSATPSRVVMAGEDAVRQAGQATPRRQFLVL